MVPYVKLNEIMEKTGKKIPVSDWLSMMGRTKHLQKEEYRQVVEQIQQETDSRFNRLKNKSFI